MYCRAGVGVHFIVEFRWARAAGGLELIYLLLLWACVSVRSVDLCSCG